MVTLMLVGHCYVQTPAMFASVKEEDETGNQVTNMTVMSVVIFFLLA